MAHVPTGYEQSDRGTLANCQYIKRATSLSSLMAEQGFQVAPSGAPPVQLNINAINDLINAILNPTEFMRRLRRTLMGNCEWYLETDPASQLKGHLILGEWVFAGETKPTGGRNREIRVQEGNFTKSAGWETFVVPPINTPLVRNSKLLYAVETRFAGIINGPQVMARPEVPNVMANMAEWNFTKYLRRNWVEFELDYGTASSLSYLYGQTAFAMFTGAQKGDNKRFFSSLMTINQTETRTQITEVPQQKGGILGFK